MFHIYPVCKYTHVDMFDNILPAYVLLFFIFCIVLHVTVLLVSKTLSPPNVIKTKHVSVYMFTIVADADYLSLHLAVYLTMSVHLMFPQLTRVNQRIRISRRQLPILIYQIEIISCNYKRPDICCFL